MATATARDHVVIGRMAWILARIDSRFGSRSLWPGGGLRTGRRLGAGGGCLWCGGLSGGRLLRRRGLLRLALRPADPIAVGKSDIH
jgi:hypothetical protein